MALPCPQDAFISVIPRDCRGSVDFSLATENYILITIPTAIFILLAPVRIKSVWYQSIKVVSPTVQWAFKTLAGLCFIATSLAVLVESAKDSTPEWRTSQLTGASVTVLASVLALVLSYQEHHRSIRPSVLLQLYLIFLVVTEAVHLRSIWLRSAGLVLRLVSLAQLASSATFLAAESCEKESILLSKAKRSPQDINDLFSQRFLLWLNNLIVMGYRKMLSPPDLYDIDEDLASQQSQRTFSLVWLLQTRNGVKMSLYWILALSLRKHFIFPIIPRLLLMIVIFTQPFTIDRFIRYIENPAAASPNEAALLVLATIVTYLFMSIFSCWYWQCTNRFVAKVRSTLITAIHDKALRSRPTPHFSPLTLMNVDVERICVGLRCQHEIWATLLMLVVSMYLIYIEMGLTFLAPLFVSSLLLAIVALNGNVISPAQQKWLASTQKRIAFVTDVIASMKNIKMMGLAPEVFKKGANLRRIEVFAQQNIWKHARLNVTISHYCYHGSAIALYGAYAIQTYRGGPPLTNALLFYSLSLLKLWAVPAVEAIQEFPGFLQSLAALGRIQQYLLVPDHHDPRQEADPVQMYTLEAGLQEPSGVKLVKFTHVTAGFPSNPSILQDISLDVWQGRLHIVIGPVGSGKSTLLKTVIGETSLLSGTVQMTTFETSFCDLPPYLWRASIRENIVGVGEWNQTWFEQVAWACGLDEDFIQMPLGIETQAGDDGNSLSGGQKNRISLARAIYSRKRLFIGDDVLSGLDTRTEALVFGRVFGPAGLLRKIGATMVLATHSVGWLGYADQVVIIDEGHTAYQGSADSIPVSFTTLISHSSSIKEVVDTAIAKEPALSAPVVDADESTRSHGKNVYLTYFGTFGVAIFVAWVSFGAVPYTARMLQTLTLQWWADKETRDVDSLVRYPAILVALVAFDAITYTGYILYFLLHMAHKSSLYLHGLQWDAMMRIAYPAWHTLGTGNIANRFSQDMSLVDTDLSLSCLNASAFVMLLIAGFVIVVIASPGITASLPLLTAIIYMLQKVYLRTSKQLRVMDLEAKAPLCAHFLETASGVVTITAFGWTQENQEKAQQLLQQSQVPYYLLLSVQQWLALVLNLLAGALMVILVAITVSDPKGSKIGLIGTAVINLMAMGEYLTGFIQQWTRFDTSIGAVDRIQTFCVQLPAEKEGHVTPGPEWLNQGRVEIKNLTATYSPDAEPILHNINLSLSPGQKIALCGRTGSGKSSLAAAIFGLLHINSGVILADGVDITTVSQDRLRNAMIALPQEPYFLPGTVRENLSLRGPVSDEAMLSILARVNLLPRFEYIAANNEAWAGPLDVELVPAGMLTRGQQQLFAMARATLCAGSILVIDEATSGLDAESDRLVQRLIREEFVGRTVVAIAHRLQTIMDFDVVVVMDKGEIVELGNPMDLRDKEGGRFAALVTSGGH